jgi:hypothetical protein
MMKVAAIAVSVVLVAGVGLPLIMYYVVSPPPGPPLAVVDIRSGQPFELTFVSNGRTPRVFLDMQCKSCSFPVGGALTLSGGDRVPNTVTISVGSSRDRAWGGHDRELEQRLLTDGPALPSGTKMVLKGSLVVGPARGLTGSPIKDAPPPLVKVLRVTVAP